MILSFILIKTVYFRENGIFFLENGMLFRYFPYFRRRNIKGNILIQSRIPY